MTEALEGEVQTKDEVDHQARVERLRDLELQANTGLKTLALAIAEIYHDRLYEEADYTSFVDYCAERFQRQKSMAYALLNAGEVFPLLPDDVASEIRNESLFRPLAGMKPKNQATVLKTAVNVSRKHGTRLTSGLVEDIAEKNMHWLPKRKRKKEKEITPEQASRERFEGIELGIAAILDCGLSGGDAVKEFGSVSTWPRGLELWTFMRDAMEGSEV